MKISILGLMFLIMFGLKLAGIVTVSWWIVTLPLYAPLVFVIVFGLLAAFATMGLKGK